MVSDIVLLKELPDFIKQSVTAYVGCVSGALLKNDYLEAIKEAGFKEIKVLDETLFPIDCMTNDPTIKMIINKLKVTKEEIINIENSISSIKIASGRIPNG